MSIVMMSLGLAFFTLLFGPGNIIYPLNLGALVGSSWLYAFVGFFVTAVCVPVLGLVASLLCRGSYKEALRYLGSFPSTLIACACMLLIGPFCILPRCIALSYEVLKPYIGQTSLITFSLCVALGIFFATLRKDYIMMFFGRFLGPMKLILISCLVLVGIFAEPHRTAGSLSALTSFSKGIFDGYGTMDLLGSLFCAGLLASQLGLDQKILDKKNRWLIARQALVIGSIGGGFLSLVYAGFFYIAGRHAVMLAGVSHGDLFTVLAQGLLGSLGGMVAAGVVTLTCITTLMALSVIFADYMQTTLLSHYSSHRITLLGTLLVAGLMSNAGFDTIMHLVEPLIMIFYPLLVALALFIIAYKLVWQKDLPSVTAANLDQNCFSVYNTVKNNQDSHNA